MTDEEQRAESEALERAVEEEDFRLRLRLGGYAAIVVFALLCLLAPFLPGASSVLSFRFMAWALVNSGLLVAAFLVWRGFRIPLGRGRFMTRRKAWRAILGAAAFSLFLSFGRDAIDWLLALFAPSDW